MARKLSAKEWGALGLIGTLVFLLWGNAWWENRERSREPQGPFSKGGVTLERLSRERAALREGPGSHDLESLVDDWEFRSKTLSLVVGTRGFGFVAKPHNGALREAVLGSARNNGLESLSTVLFAGDRELGVVVDAVTPRLDGPTPILVISAQSTRPRLDLTTHLTLDAKRNELQLVTSVVNRDGRVIPSVRLGDRVQWPGGPPFIPKQGFLMNAGRARGPFLGRPREGTSYALLFPARDAAFEMFVDEVGPTEQLALDEAVRLEPEERLTWSRLLVLDSRGMAELYARLLELRKTAAGSLRGTVEPSPLARASVEVRNSAGQLIVMEDLHDEGAFEFRLPPGLYDVTLKAPGGDHTERVTIEADKRQELRLLGPPAGALRLMVTNSLGVPSPARVTLSGRGKTPKPQLGTKQRASGLENVAYTDSGELSVELPSGQYVVRVTRGPEYSVYQKNIDINASRGQSLAVVLEQLVPTPGWIACDFHLHQAPSPDSSITLEDRVTALSAEGVELAVASDHNHVTDLGPAVRARKLSTELSTIVGVEITTVGWGHFNAFPFPPESRIPQYSGYPRDFFADVRALAPAALIQVNHPRLAGGIGYFARLRWQGEQLGPLDEGFSFDFDTLEIANGFELEKPEELERNLKEWFALLDLGHIFTAVGNSDSHTLAFQWAGYPRTYVKVESDVPGAVSDDELSRALLRGRAQISNGIFVDVRFDEHAEPGDLLVATEGQVRVRLNARAAPWVDVDRAEIWANGKLLLDAKLTESRQKKGLYELSHTLTLESDAWLVVIVRGDRPLSSTFPEGRGTPFAIVNPVFVDVDGDQKFKARLAPLEEEPEDDASLARRHEATTEPAALGDAPGGAAAIVAPAPGPPLRP